ncbi:MAG: VOC family protein [Bacteroidota bacterium]|nr:VOC family protein [Bacteroidota bacterium]
MKLEHVALSIKDRDEIERFYQDILGMTMIRSFQMDKSLAFDIFRLTESPEVFLLQKDELQLEIFLSPQKHPHGFDHICISTAQRDALVEKAKQNSYRVFRLKREHSDLVFISDMSGNTFEVKQYI